MSPEQQPYLETLLGIPAEVVAVDYDWVQELLLWLEAGAAALLFPWQAAKLWESFTEFQRVATPD